MAPKPDPLPTPRARLSDLGIALRDSLTAILAEVGGTTIRPVLLAKALKLDDSLAARLLRSVRAGDPLATLRELPAPQGLRLFLDAAAKVGVSPSTHAGADAAVRSLEQVLSELPLGRASLDTAIDGWLPEGRARAERASKQAVFKAFSQLRGFTVDTTCFAIAIQPSASGERCDALSFVALEGIRRLREGAPILLFGHTQSSRNDTPGRPDAHPQSIESLDGERGVTDARRFLLRDVGSEPDLPVRLIERDAHARIVLEHSYPPLNIPVTAAVAYITRNAYYRYASPTRAADAFLNACKIPIRTFVQDIFLHEDVYPGFIPEVVPRMDALTQDPTQRDPELLEVDRLDLETDLVRLGWGLSRVGIKEWGGYEPALKSAFSRAGWNADRFRAFRCVVRYPLPFVAFTTWFDLPAAPPPRQQT